MKTVLCAVNSAYVHKNLAVLKLSKYLGDKARVREFNINSPRDFIYNELLKEKADIYCFSTYIWNIECIKAVAERLKKATGALIILGGPEAGGDAEGLIKNCPYIDYVIKGEGELALEHLLSVIEKDEKPAFPGIYDKVGGSGIAPVLKDLPFCYNERDITENPGKIFYYETSRGCFNKCAYCISGREDVCLYDEEKVKAELLHMTSFNLPLIKLVDRSFNAYGKRSERMLRFLAEETGETCFHLEVAPDLFTEEMLEIIKSAKKGKFQFEAGIQSLNNETLSAIGRISDNEKAFSNLKKIISFGNVNVHTDIIAGLPKENFESFKNTFDMVYSLKAKRMEVGFLKVLKGTTMEELCEKYGIEYESMPPYEVIKTDCLTPFEIAEIKKAHLALDRIYNSGKFSYTVDYIEKTEKSPFELYHSLGSIISEGMSLNKIFKALL
ncbi:MAG: radical SAM protein, partial [Clostridia bacterium]|nr:radical SAM protein [Clostridia bacterium]